MRIKEVKLYKFDELSEEAKDKAIESLCNINLDYDDWYQFIFEDAEQIGLKLTEFDIQRGYCKGDFTMTAEDVAKAIIEDHGNVCETYKGAERYLKDRKKIIDIAEKDEDGEFTDEHEIYGKLDDLNEEFKRSLLESYLAILEKEYEYLSSRESIIETIEANDYEFTEDGNLD